MTVTRERPRKYQGSALGPENPYPAKNRCLCDKPKPFRDGYGDVRCLGCGHERRPDGPT